jgi:hypothetical protein
MSEPATFTPPELAARWRVKASKVLGWIRSGELSAFDVSSKPGIGRPRYRVAAEAAELFEARRAAGPTAPRSRSKKRTAAKRYV